MEHYALELTIRLIMRLRLFKGLKVVTTISLYLRTKAILRGCAAPISRPKNVPVRTKFLYCGQTLISLSTQWPLFMSLSLTHLL